jgi:hypothetical protein
MTTTRERLTNDFERALSKTLDEALAQFPPEISEMKLRDFLALAFIPQTTFSSEFCPPETPKTAMRRSNRKSELLSMTATPSTAAAAATASAVKATPVTRTRKALMTPQVFNPLLPQTPANYVAAAKRPRLTIKAATPAKASGAAVGDEEIVQFQLNSGKIVDLDFSQSPESALAGMESTDALQEVKAKIEMYASHFMQYLKFFKKLEPKKK